MSQYVTNRKQKFENETYMLLFWKLYKTDTFVKYLSHICQIFVRYLSHICHRFITFITFVVVFGVVLDISQFAQELKQQNWEERRTVATWQQWTEHPAALKSQTDENIWKKPIWKDIGGL